MKEKTRELGNYQWVEYGYNANRKRQEHYRNDKFRSISFPFYSKNSIRVLYKGGMLLKKKLDQVYQFKIILSDIKPPIWRRIQIPESYSFWDLHVAITDVMGWADYHLHEFRTKDPSTTREVKIGMLDDDDEDWGVMTLPDHKQKISKYFLIGNKKAEYLYDFGDGWHHVVQLEKIIPREKNTSYPRCIGGKRACPPEDCGGISGYYSLSEIIKNPDHKEYEEMLEWLGGKFDPEHFDTNEVRFDDPVKRRRLAYE